MRFPDVAPKTAAEVIDDTTSHFEVDDVHNGDEWALICWRYVWGPGPSDSVRGVKVMRVLGGEIVEAARLLKDRGDCRRAGELTDR